MVFEIVEGFVPELTVETIEGYFGYITNNSSPALFTGGLVVMAGSASGAYRSISSFMASVQGAARYQGALGLVFSFAFAILLLLSVCAAAVIVITGEWFLELLAQKFTVWRLMSYWPQVRFIILFFLLIGILFGIYRLTAPKEKPRNPRFLGAFVATALLVAVSMIFSWFISYASKYPVVYGSLASVAILMVWLQLCGQIILMGNVINIVRTKKQ